MSLSRPTRANVTFTGAKTGGTGSVTTANLNQGALTGDVFTFLTATGSVAITIGSTPSAFNGTAATVTLSPTSTRP